MKKLLYTQDNISWLPLDATIETYLSDEEPPAELCSSAYALVFKDGSLLQTDLREGERPVRILDIPGGHCDEGELPDSCAVRETFEETGVRVRNPKLVAYKKIIIQSEKPDEYRYPYPVSYMAYYLCEISEETDFAGNDEVHGRVWLKLEEYEKAPWFVEEKVMVDEIMRSIV